MKHKRANLVLSKTLLREFPNNNDCIGSFQMLTPVLFHLLLKVLVHSPYDFPEVSGKGFAVAEMQEAFIAVEAERVER